MPGKIEDYALIGDCETAALVHRNGSIDWLCWPDFSSDACFASLLGTEDNGYWKIAPAQGRVRTNRRYRPHTLILETTFETADGAVRLIDFMPARGTHSDVVRIVEGIRGKVPMRMDLALRFDFGRTIPWVTASARWLPRHRRAQPRRLSRVHSRPRRKPDHRRRLHREPWPARLVHAHLRPVLRARSRPKIRSPSEPSRFAEKLLARLEQPPHLSRATIATPSSGR